MTKIRRRTMLNALGCASVRGFFPGLGETPIESKKPEKGIKTIYADILVAVVATTGVINVVTLPIIGKRTGNNGSKNCSHRTTLKSGTVMQNNKLPFQYWFIGMHLITSTKKSFSSTSSLL